MAANITFGAVIESTDAPQPQPQAHSPPQSQLPPPQLQLPPQSDNDSAMSKEAGFDSTNPYSAFYKHPSARRSLDASAPPSKTHLDVTVYEHDLEAGSVPLSTATTQTQNQKPSVDGRVKECTMWPSRQTIMEKKKMSKRAKGCNLFRNLNSKQRLWAKILIAALVVAAAVGLGVGITRAVGGGVWKSKGQTQGIA
ncbi:hypothetical protein P280DRAFT_228402 [Massarina eburnea CBS 473.64]|uniref:Uncharacterized protein n=1 Tax=Massarina eburnea CBS 473.64 TaxID=1395130 RepID=A0A6A6SAI9_9PLEO|nr:hypothetical protein P280DRAFT_228402 [Massarina eburnea CBS 473.64]